MQTKVINIKSNEKYDVYIGRPSIYGNPFEIGKDGDRDMVIKLYRFYFYNRLEHDNHFKEEVLKLKGKILGCFCVEKSIDYIRPNKVCHGEIILEYLENQGEKGCLIGLI
jgi:hypothetical protein